MPYLSETLKDTGPVDFKFVARSDLQVKPKKAGGTYECYEYTFVIPATGKPHVEKIFPKTHDFVLSKAKEGQLCRASIGAKGYVEWTLIPFGEEALSVPPVQSNTASVAAERQVSKVNDEQKIKGVEIGLRGLVQAYIASGVCDDPLAAAVEMDALIRIKAKELASVSPL